MLSTVKLLKFPMSWNNVIKMLFKTEYSHDKYFGSGIWQQKEISQDPFYVIYSLTYTWVFQEVLFFLVFKTKYYMSNGILSGEWRVKLQHLETILASTIRDRCGVTIKYRSDIYPFIQQKPELKGHCFAAGSFLKSSI